MNCEVGELCEFVRERERERDSVVMSEFVRGIESRTNRASGKHLAW